MPRKLVLLVAVPLVLTACDSITGPRDGTTQTPNVPIKQCEDDLRAVRLVRPGLATVVNGHPFFPIAWQVENVCSTYDVEVWVCLDGHTWISIFRSCCDARTEAGSLESWGIPFWPTLPCGATVGVRVTVRDDIGELTDTAWTHIICLRPRIRPPQERT